MESLRFAGKLLSPEASRMSIWYVSPRMSYIFRWKSSDVGSYCSSKPSRRKRRRMDVLPTRGAPSTTMRQQFCGLVEPDASGRGCSCVSCCSRDCPLRTRAASWSSADRLHGLRSLEDVVYLLPTLDERALAFFSWCFHCDVASLRIPIPALDMLDTFIPGALRCCVALLYARRTFEEPTPLPLGNEAPGHCSVGPAVFFEFCMETVTGSFNSIGTLRSILLRWPNRVQFNSSGLLRPSGSPQSFWLAQTLSASL